ncbi:MAG: hypothetical protein JWQ40_400 [Segetibacter sp.]|nr:hypothetical protein [Segetibacter sp.]
MANPARLVKVQSQTSESLFNIIVIYQGLFFAFRITSNKRLVWTFKSDNVTRMHNND